MYNSILNKAKFLPPKEAPHWIIREELVQKLDAESDSMNLTWVQAPAGYGKSTFVAQWLTGLDVRFGWLCLDSYDNELTRFWHYFIAAISSRLSQGGKLALQILTEGGEDIINDVLSALLNELLESESRRPFYLVLDDFHEITNPLIVDSLNYLMRYLPNQIRLVFISRHGLKLFRSKLYSKSNIRMIDNNDLKVSQTVTRQLLLKHYVDRLPETVVDTIHSLTDGWIAAIHLFGSYLQRQSQDRWEESCKTLVSMAVQTGYKEIPVPEVLLNYFVREVLEDFDAPQRRTLIVLSLAPRIYPGLCNHLLEPENGFDAVRPLLRQYSLICSVQGEEEIYRFHDLFRTVLCTLANEELSRQEVAMLKNKIFLWMADNDASEAHFYYAIENHLWSYAADSLEALAKRYRRLADYQRLSDCIERIPSEVLDGRLALLSHYCWCLAHMSRNNKMRFYVKKAKSLFENVHENGESKNWNQQQKEDAVEHLVTISISERLCGNYSMDHSIRSLNYATELNVDRLTKVYLELGQDAYMVGDLEKSCQWLILALDYAAREKEGYAIAVASFFMFLVGMHTGQLGKIMEKLETIQHWLAEDPHQPEMMFGKQILDLSIMALWQEQNLDRAESSVENRIHQMGSPITNYYTGLSIYTLLYRVCLMNLNLSGAHKAINLIASLENNKAKVFRLALPSVEGLRVELGIYGKNTQVVSDWVDKNQQTLIKQKQIDACEDRIILCRGLFFLGRYESAIQIAGLILRHKQLRLSNASRLTAYGVLICAYDALNQQQQVTLYCGKLLDLLTSLDYFRKPLLLFWEFPQLRTLLADQRAISPLAATLDLLIPETKGGHSLLGEPLSQREQDVLMALSEGLSNSEIADKLYISINTVKSHLKNIYDKFQVKNRTQALAKAHELDWL